MEQQLSENSASGQGEQGSLDASLQHLWDKARAAGDVIVRLRGDNASLHERLVQAEEELRRANAELHDVKERLKTAPQTPATGSHAPLLDNGEREAMAGKIKDLLSKLDAYL